MITNTSYFTGYNSFERIQLLEDMKFQYNTNEFINYFYKKIVYSDNECKLLFSQLIAGCLQFDVNERFTSDKIVEYLNILSNKISLQDKINDFNWN